MGMISVVSGGNGRVGEIAGGPTVSTIEGELESWLVVGEDGKLSPDASPERASDVCVTTLANAGQYTGFMFAMAHDAEGDDTGAEDATVCDLPLVVALPLPLLPVVSGEDNTAGLIPLIRGLRFFRIDLRWLWQGMVFLLLRTNEGSFKLSLGGALGMNEGS